MMNCQLLNQAILQNEQAAQKIQQQLEQILETGKASKNQIQQLEQSLSQATQNSEQSLTNFIPDFKEAFNLQEIYKYSDEITGFINDIKTSLPLPGGDILVAGENGETRILRQQENGEYKYSDEITDFINDIETTLQLPGGDILVAGYNGETRILHQQKLNEAQDIRDRAGEILGGN